MAVDETSRSIDAPFGMTQGHEHHELKNLPVYAAVSESTATRLTFARELARRKKMI